MRQYAGLDLSMKTVAICVIDEEGKVIGEKSVERNPEAIWKYLKDFGLECIGLESGSGSHWLTRELLEKGLPAICMDARALAGFLKARRVNKTDRNDAMGIAEALKGKIYKEVHVKSEEAVTLKMQLAIRRRIVGAYRNERLGVRGLLKEGGLYLGPVSKADFVSRVREVIEVLDEQLIDLIEGMLELIEKLQVQLKKADALMRKMGKERADCVRLMTIPGVGPVTALTFVSEIDDIHRFERSRPVGAYVGLTPRESSSGTVKRLGGISKAGSKELRSLLVESGIVIIGRCRKWSKLKAWGLKIMKKHGMKKAAVAVGRKLSVIMHRMLVTETDFRFGEEKLQKAA